jgi:hypothetical protein
LRRIYKTDGNVFRKNTKVIWIVGSPARRSRSVYTDVSSDQVKDREDKNKCREKKRHTYPEKIIYRATEAAQRDKSPQNTSRPVQTVSQEHTGYRDKTYHWIEPTRVTGRPKSNPNSQSNRKPAGTERGNRTESPKTPSVPQAPLGTVWVLETAIAIRIQALFRDTEVPGSIHRKVSKIDKNICKTGLNRAVRSPLGKSQSVNTSVNYNGIKDGDKKEKKTYYKKKLIEATKTPQNGNQTVKAKVSYDHEERETYPGKSRQERDCERPREDQRSITWACKPGEWNGREKEIEPTRRDPTEEIQPMKESVSNHEKRTYLGKWGHEKTDRGRPPEGQNPQRNQNLPRVCKFEWACKPAADQRNETEKVIGLMGHDPPEETESGPTTEGVSYDHHKEKTHLKLLRFGNRDSDREGTYLGKSRCRNRDSGGPWEGQELRRELMTHRACEPGGRCKNKKNSIRRRNTKETYQERRKEEIHGGGPGEPRPRTGLNWASRPTSSRNKNKVPPVCNQ